MAQRTTTSLNEAQNEEVKVSCADCNNPTRHKVVFSVDLTHDFDHEITASESYQTVQCLGCDSLSFRLVRGNSEDFYFTDKGVLIYDEREEIYPPRVVGRPKMNDSYLLPYLNDSYPLPYQVKLIYDDTHKALCSEMYILASIGIRALIEAVCAEKNAQGKNLEQKIENLVELGVLTKAGAKILHQIRVMGNAAAHEVKRHDLDTLGTAFDVAENLLQNVYILPKKASRLAKSDKRGPRNN